MRFEMYNPDPGRPDFPESNYEQYQWDMSRHTTPPLRVELPEAPAAERLPHYNDCLIAEDSFQQGMRECIGEPPPEPIPVDQNVRSTGLMVGPECLDDVVDDEAQPDPCQEMASALEQQVQKAEAEYAAMQAPPMEDPNAAQQMYEDELQQRMNPFGMMMGPGPMM